jgi:aspartate-semialdehyde dehydrogenase
MSTNSTSKARVAVAGATGVAGQQFLAELFNHPSLRITKLAASARSAGKTYREAISDDSGQLNWFAAGVELDEDIAKLPVVDADKLDVSDVDVVFSCMDAGPAREYEGRWAKDVPVVSTASAFRYEDDVPLVIPGVNHSHLELLRHQQKERGWKGFVAPNPNCTTVGLAITLAPLHAAFGVKRVHMVSLQSVSGAGRSPGVRALDVVDNVIPYIPKEEGKVERETQKILGTLNGTTIEAAKFSVSSTCTRIGVLEGHTEVVHVELAKAATREAVSEAWANFGRDLAHYHSAPPQLVVERTDPFRPQVRLDRDTDDGMATVVGRLRADEAVDNGWKYVLVSHNTKMGAAKGCILVAEYLQDKGYIAK